MKTIILSYSPTAKAWVAETLVDGNPCPECLDSFGTHVIPTAFTKHANGREVLDRIRALNPDAVVTL